MNALLALFARSLRELLKSKLSYVVSGLTVGIIFFFLLFAQGASSAMTAPGLKFLEHSLFVVLTFITLAGVSYFASAITEEKEEGTLGLLRMTDLSALAILLGKSTSRLSAALLLLAATLPFTLLAVTLGGVSARQVFASYATLGAYLILLANIALLASVLSPRGAIASVLTGTLVFGTPTLAGLLTSASGWLPNLPIGSRVSWLIPWFTNAGQFLNTLSPFRRLDEILTTGFNGPLLNGQFWGSLAVAVVCLLLGWILFDPIAGEAPRFSIPRPVPRPNSRFERFAPNRAWLISAVAWKDFHFLHGGWIMLLARWIGYGAISLTLGIGNASGTRGLTDSGAAIVWAMFAALAIELCLIGSRILRTELRDKTLIGLAGLPLSMQHIIMMKLDGARRSLVPAFTWLCVGFVVMIGNALWEGLGKSNVIHFNIFGTLIILAYLASQAWLLAHLAAHFSLKLSWGALPISFGIVFLANIVGIMFCIGFFVMPIVALTYVTQLRASIYQRLEQLASEE
jgi:ABC-type transport system involved in multi-copper enzyme maturation permease subunit